jgi:ferrous-iron efflux pump FieF
MKTETASTQHLRRLASNASFAMALCLVGIKVVAWVLTGSMALLAAAVDGVLDVCTSAVTFVGVRYAERPEDHNHRYGHGKGETLAGFMQAILLGGAGLTLAIQASEKLFHPAPLQAVAAGLIMTAGSLVAVSGLVTLQTWVIRRTGSTAISADRQHYIADIVVNVGVLVSLSTTRLTGWERVDPVIGLGLSIYMMWSAWEMIRHVMHSLLDEELPIAERSLIEQAVRKCEGVCDLHDLRTRIAGEKKFIEFHLEVDGNISVRAGHDICELAAASVRALYDGNADVLVHAEPAGIEDERLDHRIGGAERPVALGETSRPSTEPSG